MIGVVLGPISCIHGEQLLLPDPFLMWSIMGILSEGERVLREEPGIEVPCYDGGGVGVLSHELGSMLPDILGQVHVLCGARDVHAYDQGAFCSLVIGEKGSCNIPLQLWGCGDDL